MKIKPLLLFFLLTTVTISAQNTRYVDEVFDSVVVLPENIYSLNIDILTSPPSLDSLRFDLYMPAGDTATNRPLVVVLHTGTFLPKGFVAASGDKNDYANIESCKRLARMGYVAASINYRVGWNPQAPSDVERRAGILNAAFRSIQDMYTYIRFMDMTVQDQGNPFRVDPDKVAIFGIGTGGFLGINAAVLDKWREEIYIDKFRNPVNGTPFIDTNLVGVITGERMAPLCVANWVGYSNDFHFAMGLDGAAGDSSWMETGDVTVPIVCAGVVIHPTTPFGIDPITG